MEFQIGNNIYQVTDKILTDEIKKEMGEEMSLFLETLQKLNRLGNELEKNLFNELKTNKNDQIIKNFCKY